MQLKPLRCGDYFIHVVYVWQLNQLLLLSTSSRKFNCFCCVNRGDQFGPWRQRERREPRQAAAGIQWVSTIHLLQQYCTQKQLYPSFSWSRDNKQSRAACRVAILH